MSKIDRRYSTELDTTHQFAMTVLRSILASVLLCATLPVQGQPATSKAAEIYRSAKDSVVQIVTEMGLGSGFFVDDGTLIVTNHHVIRGASDITIRTSGGLEFGVDRIVRTDAALDVAILSAPVKGRPLRFAAATPDIGVDVFAIGSPQGFDSTLSVGIVSGLREDGPRRLIQFSAPISPGSSGGPVLDVDGRVVGVVSFLYTQGQNLNFAVSINDVLALMAGQANSSATPSATSSSNGTVVPDSVIVDLGPRQRGVEIAVWNTSDCLVTDIVGTISFIPRPTRDAPILYEERFEVGGGLPAGQRRTIWLPVDAVEGHGAGAPPASKWYSRTVVNTYASSCPATR